MDLAAAHFQARRYDRAAAALVGVLRRDPGNAQAMALLCEVQVRVKLRITSERLLPRRVAPATPGSRRRDTEAEHR